MGFWSRLFSRKKTQNVKNPPKKLDPVKLKPVIGELSCNASKYLVHVSRCDKNSLDGWDMCPEHVRMWETTASDERV